MAPAYVPPMQLMRRGERGSASVEHAALVLLMALVAFAVVAALTIGGGDGDRSLAAAIAFKQRLRGPLSGSLLAGPAE